MTCAILLSNPLLFYTYRVSVVLGTEGKGRSLYILEHHVDFFFRMVIHCGKVV